MQFTIIKSHDSSIGRVLESSMKVHGFNPPQRQQTFFLNFSHFYPIFNVVSQIPHEFFLKNSFQILNLSNSA